MDNFLQYQDIMDNKSFDDFRRLAKQELLDDSKNPIYIFSMIDTELLLKIRDKKIDLKTLINIELELRGIKK